MTPAGWFIASDSGVYYGRCAPDGSLSAPRIASSLPLNYLVADRDNQRIYATARSNICAFDWSDGAVRFLFQESCMGQVACHLCLSPDQRHLFCANYISGNVTVFKITDHGFEFTQSITGKGHCGSNPERQNGPHAHYCSFINGNLYVVDLGQDAIFIFSWDGKKVGSELHRIVFPPGSGPRHIVYDPVQNRILCAGELSNELFVVDGNTFELVNRIQVGCSGDALSAIRLSSDGKVVALGIRGSDMIALFETENWQCTARFGIGGKCVRDFDFLNDHTLCICCQESSKVTIVREFSRQKWDIQQSLEIKKPMNVIFAECN